MAFLIWKGPSLFDGAPIVVLASSRPSTNRKTGDLIQTYILREDIHPQEAVASNQDTSICGTCRFRGDHGKKRKCYVNLRYGPYSVWWAYRRGNAPQIDLREFARRKVVRIGAYGDPAAVPTEVWLNLLSEAAGHTGYTHAWRTCDPRLKSIVQASCDHPEDYREAKAAGWHTLRVRLPDEPRMLGERPCPAAAEVKNDVTCADCMGCNGQRRDFVVTAHGTAGQVAEYRKFRLTRCATSPAVQGGERIARTAPDEVEDEQIDETVFQ